MSKKVGILEDRGVGGKLGLRSQVGERMELDASVRIHRIVDETEAQLTVGGRYRLTDVLSVGLALQLARTTDRNFDNIRKLMLSLRHHF